MNIKLIKTAVILALAVHALFVACTGAEKGRVAGKAAGGQTMTIDTRGPWDSFERPSFEELRETLDPLQYNVTQESGTEPPFHNTFWNNHEEGLYVDVVSGEPLFSSLDKFDSGSGWPSFTRPVDEKYITEREDRALGMRRVEVRSSHGESHLGHVFDDGPAPTGLRYCINSAALRFIPVDELAGEGYGAFLPLFGRSGEMSAAPAPDREVATLAGGCFWGMEDILREIPGVVDTEVGYTGGHVDNATYGDVRSGKSGHAEAIQVVFDPKEVTYEEILSYFFRMHDPTTLNRQGNDIGTQYRSAIFYHSEEQRQIAERVKRSVDASRKWQKPIVTEIVPAGPFYKAEEYHQDYLEKTPGGYSCHYLRD